MKKTMLTLLAVAVLSLTGKSQLSEVVSVDSTLKKQQLYSNALSFFATTFVSANDVIQMKDAETGKVVGKGRVNGIETTITISCKDGKYKYDLEFTGADVTFQTNKFGSYKGTSTGKYRSGSFTDVQFVNSGMSPFTVAYDGTGMPMGMKNAYTKWKAAIDEEMKTFSIDTNAPAFKALVVKLKESMSKAEW